MSQEIRVRGLIKPLYFDDNATDEQIDHAIKTEILPQLPELQRQEQADMVKEAQQKAFKSGSKLEQFLAGTGRGLMDIYEGVSQAGLEAGNALHLVKDETLSNFNDKAQAERDVWNTAATGAPAGVGRFAGQFLPTMLLPGGPAGKGFFGAARQGLIQGAEAGALQFTGEDDSRVANTLEGAGLGAAGGVAGKFVEGLVPKIVNAVKGKMGPAEAKVEDLANQFGVRATAGDVSGQPGFKRAEQGMEYLPGLGMTKYREQQANEVKAALEKVVNKYSDKLPQTDYQWLQEVKNDAAKGALGVQGSTGSVISANKANKLLADINKAGGDPDEIIKVSAALKEYRAHKIATNYYDQVENLAGSTKIPTTNLKASLKAVSKADRDALLSEPDVASMVKEIQKKVDPPFKMKNGVPQVTPVKEFDYGQLRKARSDLKDRINTLNRLGKFKEANALGQIKDGLESDIQKFTNSNPALQQAQQKADTFYRAKYGPIRDYARKFYANKEADVLTQKGLNPKSADASQKFYSSLDDKGRAAVRYNVVQDAWDKAFDQATNRISPAKFAAHLEKNQQATQFFFKGQDKQEIDGLVTLLRHLDRAGDYASKPSATSRIGQLGVLGGVASGMAFNLPLALKAYGGAYVLKQLMISTVGKRILLAASKLGPKQTKALSMLTSKLPAVFETSTLYPGNEADQSAP